mmetsp:Transcript_50601/g.133130  ORF Transcript_50601/g.133130 Transcript_50601/m.133130 type:complete len:356 (-) Transcript_50601:117-1184(-)
MIRHVHAPLTKIRGTPDSVRAVPDLAVASGGTKGNGKLAGTGSTHAQGFGSLREMQGIEPRAVRSEESHTTVPSVGDHHLVRRATRKDGNSVWQVELSPTGASRAPMLDHIRRNLTTWLVQQLQFQEAIVAVAIADESVRRFRRDCDARGLAEAKRQATPRAGKVPRGDDARWRVRSAKREENLAGSGVQAKNPVRARVDHPDRGWRAVLLRIRGLDGNAVRKVEQSSPHAALELASRGIESKDDIRWDRVTVAKVVCSVKGFLAPHLVTPCEQPHGTGGCRNPYRLRIQTDAANLDALDAGRVRNADQARSVRYDSFGRPRTQARLAHAERVRLERARWLHRLDVQRGERVGRC